MFYLIPTKLILSLCLLTGLLLPAATTAASPRPKVSSTSKSKSKPKAKSKTKSKAKPKSKPSSKKSSASASRSRSSAKSPSSTASRPHPVPASSLYQPSVAQKLDIKSLSLFGPQASKFKYDARMVHAAEIAAARAHGRSTGRCWHYVKNALLAAHIIDSRPKTGYAKEAAAELTADYGFLKVREKNPYKAPIGSVIVYGGGGAGHVEFRSQLGFVSDFVSPNPSTRPLLGIYVKPQA